MKAVLAAVGSRGDVEPMVALGERLLDAGHRVSLVTHASLLAGVPASLEAVGADSDPAELLAGPAADALRRGNVRALNRTRHLFADFLHAFAEPTASRLTGSDVLVASTFATPAVDAAMRAGVPVVRAHFWPEYPRDRPDAADTARFSAPDSAPDNSPDSSLGAGPVRPRHGDSVIPLAPYSWLAPPVARRALRRGLDGLGPYVAGVDGQWRRGRLQLTARHPSGFTTNTHGALYAFSPIVSRPRRPDGRATGWWRRTDADRAHLTADTRRLLARPGPWIAVGFGSMPQRSRGRLLDVLSTAVTRVGVGAIVQIPGVIGEVAPGIVGIGYEPHEALLPRLAAVVHHGGSGTSGSALRAGIPSVVVPHFADQFYWGRRLAQLGVAPRPIPRPLLTAAALARRLEAALAPALAERAERVGAVVAAEDGTGQAVRLLEDRLDRR